MKILDQPISLGDLKIMVEKRFADPRHRKRLKEITRLRELLLDFFLGENEYRSIEQDWRNYFHGFACAASLKRKERCGKQEGNGR